MISPHWVTMHWQFNLYWTGWRRLWRRHEILLFLTGRMYNATLRSAPLYGCKTWPTRYRRSIAEVWYQHRVIIDEVPPSVLDADSCLLSETIVPHCFWWLAHVLLILAIHLSFRRKQKNKIVFSVYYFPLYYPLFVKSYLHVFALTLGLFSGRRKFILFLLIIIWFKATTHPLNMNCLSEPLDEKFKPINLGFSYHLKEFALSGQGIVGDGHWSRLLSCRTIWWDELASLGQSKRSTQLFSRPSELTVYLDLLIFLIRHS